jgi:hypothetical protein
MTAAVFITFLTQLITSANKKIFLIVDNLSVHDALAVEEWLADKKTKSRSSTCPPTPPNSTPTNTSTVISTNINTDGLPKDREELQGKLQRFMEYLASLDALPVTSKTSLSITLPLQLLP